MIAWTPAWARPAGAVSGKCAPADPAQFAAFAAAAVRRYAPQGIHTWEIWNEPYLLTCWRPAVDPAGYVQLLQVTVAAMRQEDPQAFIVSGGLAPGGSSDAGNLSQLDFLAQMCALGANHLVDAIGYHPYTYPVTPRGRGHLEPLGADRQDQPQLPHDPDPALHPSAARLGHRVRRAHRRPGHAGHRGRRPPAPPAPSTWTRPSRRSWPPMPSQPPCRPPVWAP